MDTTSRRGSRGACAVQGYLAHKKQPPRRTMSRALWWPWGGAVFLMSEVPLYAACYQPSRLDQFENLRCRICLARPPQKGCLPFHKSLNLVQNQLLARMANWSNREGWWSQPLVLGGSVKLNQRSENRRFGLDGRVGGTLARLSSVCLGSNSWSSQERES